MLAVIVLIIFAVAFVIMGYILSYGGTKSCKGCIYNTEPYLVSTFCKYYHKEHLIIAGCSNRKSRTQARREKHRKKGNRA